MTVSSTTRKAGPFFGNGVTTVFPFSFKVFDKTDVSVIKADTLGAGSTLSLDADYSVAVNSDQNNNPGGTITYPISGVPLSAGFTLTVLGALEYEQPTDLTNSGGFYPEVIEDGLDRLQIQIQQLAEIAGRALQVPPADGSGSILPSSGARSGMMIGFDSSGNLALLPIPAAVGAGDLRNENWTAGTDFVAGTDSSVTLSRAYVSKTNLGTVVMDGVVQDPSTYSIAGTSLQFNAVIPAWTSRVWCYGGTTLSLNIPAFSSILDAMIAAGSALFNRVNDLISVRDPAYGARGLGFTDDSTAFQLAIDHTSAYLGGGIIDVPAGAYRFDSPVTMRSNVTVRGRGYAKILQGNNKNLSGFFLFGAASNAYVQNLTFDGNRDNNTNDLNHQLIHLQNGTDVGVLDCTLLNAPGYSVASNAMRAKILRNRISNAFGPIGLYNAIYGNLGPTSAFAQVEGNYCEILGKGALVLGSSDYAIVRGNHFVGTAIGGRGARLTVNTSGTTCTWASGPQFGAIKPGMFLVINEGMEFEIASVQSATQFTVTSGMPTLSGAAASVGTGDVVGGINSSYANIYGNTVTGGVTFGIGLSLGGASWGCSHNSIRDNHIHFAGKNAINISYDGGAGFLFNNEVVGNHIYDAGSSPGTSTSDRISIFIGGGTLGKVESTFIDGNYCFSDGGDGQQPYWFGTDGNVNLGSVKIGPNAAVGFANAGILNDVAAVNLGPGWGSGPVVSNVVSTGRSLRFTITAGSGAGSGAASIAVPKICTVPEQIVLLDAKVQTTSGALAQMWGEQTSTLTEWDATFTGSPVAGATYTVVMQA